MEWARQHKRLRKQTLCKFRPLCSIKMEYISSCGDRWYKLIFTSPSGTTMLCFSHIIFFCARSYKLVWIPELSPACLCKASHHNHLNLPEGSDRFARSGPETFVFRSSQKLHGSIIIQSSSAKRSSSQPGGMMGHSPRYAADQSPSAQCGPLQGLAGGHNCISVMLRCTGRLADVPISRVNRSLHPAEHLLTLIIFTGLSEPQRCVWNLPDSRHPPPSQGDQTGTNLLLFSRKAVGLDVWDL